MLPRTVGAKSGDLICNQKSGEKAESTSAPPLVCLWNRLFFKTATDASHSEQTWTEKKNGSGFGDGINII